MMKRWLTHPSIARRQLLSLLGAYALVWLVVVAISSSAATWSDSGDYDREMRSMSNVIDSVIQTPGLSLSSALESVRLKLVQDGKLAGVDGAPYGFEVRDAADQLIARGGVVLPDFKDVVGAGFVNADVQGQRWRLLREVSLGGERMIIVAQTREMRWKLLSAGIFNTTALLQLLACIPLLFLPIWLAVWTGLAPLRRLSESLSARQAGDLAPVQLDPPHRELMPMADALNGTLARLSELLNRERAFLADAAHELRTPLAVISAQYDTLRHSPSGPQWDEALKRLGLGVNRSARLVNQLLVLARLEAGDGSRRTRVDLANLMRDCLALQATEAARRGIELSYLGCDSLIAWVPEHGVETVVHNLVSNAIRYGRPGGQVEAVLELGEEDWCGISVSDDGPGLAEDEHGKVFERFWRGSAATTASPGSGLGLSIVMAAARQLEGQVRMSPGLGGKGLRVSLFWRLERERWEPAATPGTAP
ncbi:sensor histidine kinase [Roseateles depolymerans]|uniref:histidine kinase n=1 Tax=Roseateles depolymerans TaxID=76731 RepID=A0A0U3L1K6_9BURK|nr:ATP-binding protein [Roseateles depolymerans]ALV05198.1 Signal transduction histidine kinase [Roseateles depolymerans]REG14786.1 two-component system sensor histidine kinase QseC [Roseateles depolymerans]